MLSKTGKKIVSFSVLLVLFGFILAAPPVFAKTDILGTEYGQFTGLGKRDIRYTLATLISVILGLLGMISLLIVLYAGFMWMTAGGNEEKANTAKKILWAGIIGLVIITSSYAISNFALKNLWFVTSGYRYKEF